MAESKICSISGCGKPHYGMGYCNLHWRRFKDHGSAEWVPPKPQLVCSIEGCDKPHTKKGYCNAHYLRWKRHGDPLTVTRRTEPNHCGKQECPAAKKVWGHLHYLRNEQAYKDRVASWREDNKEQYENRIKEYFSRDEVRERQRKTTIEWAKKNKERKKKSDKEYVQNNRPRVRGYQAKRRALVRNAAPAWLTNEHKAQIQAKYDEAERLTQETGIPHDVDHIVPLAGKIVCGLHVPWNLRPLPRVVNNRRPRIYQGDDVPIDSNETS